MSGLAGHPTDASGSRPLLSAESATVHSSPSGSPLLYTTLGRHFYPKKLTVIFGTWVRPCSDVGLDVLLKGTSAMDEGKAAVPGGHRRRRDKQKGIK